MKETNAIIAVIDAVRTRASTSEVILSLALPIEKAALISSLMSKVGHSVGVAFADVENASRGTLNKSHEVSQKPKNFGTDAKALRLSSFFRTPAVWEQVGTDEEFLDWVRSQPCSVCDDYDYLDDGRKVTEAAHVRRVANGAGTGIKPRSSAIPLCHKHHVLQHAKGEAELNLDFTIKRMEAVRKWGWMTLKKQLGYESWKDVPPHVLKAWATEHNVSQYLPIKYR